MWVAGPVVRREDFRHEIRGQRCVSTPRNPGRARPIDEGEVRRAHRIGIGRDLEAGVLPEHRTQRVRADIGADENVKDPLHAPVVRARWLAHDQRAAHERGGKTHALFVCLPRRQSSSPGVPLCHWHGPF